MRIFLRQFALPLLMGILSGKGMAVRAVAISDVSVVPNGEQVKVSVRLTGAVEPRVVVAKYPDRLVLELPNTATSAKQRRIVVNQEGVRDLRIGLKSVAPLLTRVVLDMDSARPYQLVKSGNTVELTVLAPTDGNPAPEVAKEITVISRASGVLDGITVVSPAITLATTPRVVNRRVRAGFRIKYVAEGSAYLEAGRNSGLEEGMHLLVRESGRGGRSIAADADFDVAAHLCVVSVAQSSSVTEVSGSKRVLRTGDWAYLSAEDTELLAQKKAASAGITVVTSSSGSRSESSSRSVSTDGTSSAVPGLSLLGRSPEPYDIGHVSARVGLDYSGIVSHGLTVGNGTQIGLSVRTDITRIGGTYWNLDGYWRGRITKRSSTGEDTLRDVLNKTYTMQLTYDNPGSNWVAGVGRLYLPWANSLDTIDGGYVGRRIASGETSGVTVGAFAGSTPDPTSWHYNPDRQIGGAFVNFEGGSFDSFRYTSTTGVAASSLKWRLDRPFLFLENAVYYKDKVSVYHSLIVDAPQGVSTDGITPGTGISRSYLTVHYQPYQRVSFDFYHNYFRDVPTASTQLVGTGLVDKLLYQGTSVGARVEPIRHVFLYGTIGHSDKTGDKEGTLNWMQGVTLDEIGRTGFRADLRYSKFNGTFASGNYKVVTLSRHLGDRMMWDLQLGDQSFVSAFTANNHNRFVDSSLDMNLGKHSYFQSGYTVVHGGPTNYNQWYLSLGYRFDGKPAGK